MDLLAFERKLDQTIMRKRLDIQEALKRPIKVGGGCVHGYCKQGSENLTLVEWGGGHRSLGHVPVSVAHKES